MKTFKSLLLALAASFLLIACGGGSPESVVKKYFKAAQNADFKTARKCVTKEVAVRFDKEIGNLDEDEINRIKERNSKVTLKFIRTDIDGDMATVYFEEVRDEKSSEKSLPLLKEDGEWKISKFY